MTNHYGRLFRYRQGPHRSPTENFLTEAMSDLLASCPAHIGHEFVQNVLFRGNRQACDSWRSSLNEGQLVFRTQHWTGNGFVDLLIEAEGRPAIVLECKVFAEIRVYGENTIEPIPTEADSLGKEIREVENQLTRYGTWLAKRERPNNWKGAVALLSHLLPPPDGFLDGAPKYGDVWRSATSWAHAHRWLLHQSKTASDTQYWVKLASELAKFLQEINMSADSLTSKDLASGNLFLDSSARYNAAFERVRSRAKEAIWKIKQGNVAPWEFEPEYNCICETIALSSDYQPKGESLMVAWGIRFPSELDNNWLVEAKPSLPKTDHAFVWLWNEGAKELALSGFKAPGWSVIMNGDEAGVVAAARIADLMTSPEEFSDKLAEWVNEKLCELRDKVLPALRRAMS